MRSLFASFCFGALVCMCTQMARAGSPIDGVYELVSETSELTKPHKETLVKTAADWTGVWIFNDSFYSATLMKKRREHFPERLDYWSSAGRYTIKSDQLVLGHELDISPLQIDRPDRFEFRTEGDKLILVATHHPYVEDLREGKTILILKRASATTLPET